MTLDEARELIGHAVIYRPFAGEIPERGVITSVNEHWVFVRYGHNTVSEATESGLLMAAGAPSQRGGGLHRSEPTAHAAHDRCPSCKRCRDYGGQHACEEER